MFLIVQGVSIYVSTLSWTAIALDRLKAVNSPTTINMKSNRQSSVIKIVIINIISVLAILPYCAHMEVGFIRISYSQLYDISDVWVWDKYEGWCICGIHFKSSIPHTFHPWWGRFQQFLPLFDFTAQTSQNCYISSKVQFNQQLLT